MNLLRLVTRKATLSSYHSELQRQVDIKRTAHCVHFVLKEEKLNDSALLRLPDEVTHSIGEFLVTNYKAKLINHNVNLRRSNVDGGRTDSTS